MKNVKVKKGEELVNLMQQLFEKYVKDNNDASLSGFKVWVKKLLNEL